MTALAEGPILVGVDGSGGGYSALGWAAAEAGRRQRPLHIVHALGSDQLGRAGHGGGVPPEPDAGFGDGSSRPSGVHDQVLEAALQRAVTVAPGISVITETVSGRPGPALVRRSQDAGMVVTGARGQRRAVGSLVGSLVGSVSLQVAMHATCPAVVVRESPDRDPGEFGSPRIVVGVDGSAGSVPALEFAIQQASLHKVGLTAVHAWWVEVVAGGALRAVPSTQWDELVAEQRSVVSEALVGWREKYPEVSVREHVLQAHPVEALIDHSVGAELVVVGSRGLGGFSGLVLGSVSHGVLQRSLCPVAVVRERDRGRDDR